MTNQDGKHTGSPDAPPNDALDTPEAAQLQADIERTREDLAETVDLLAAKLDVRSRVREQVGSTVATTRTAAVSRLRTFQTRATGLDGRPTRATISTAGGVVAAAAAVVLVRLWLGSSSHQRARRHRAVRRELRRTVRQAQRQARRQKRRH